MIVLIFSLTLCLSPYLPAQQTRSPGKGNLIGKIYAKDGVTAVVGALAKIKNVATAKTYESRLTDKLGSFKIQGIEEGLYSVGIVTDEGEFNVESLIGIKANKTLLITLVLKPYLKEEIKKAEVRSEILKSDKVPSKILKFFASPVGLAIIVATTGLVAYGIIKLLEKEEEVSPFKN
jgi:hypothetical protein